MSTFQSRRRFFLSILVTFALFFGLGDVPRGVSEGIVISQVYSAGGSSGSVYRNDYVELFNRALVPERLDGMSLQFVTATGTALFGTNVLAVLSGTLQPGQYFLVQLGGGNVGAALPRADLMGSTPMPPGGGRVALVASTTGLGCNGASAPCSVAQRALILDLLGWGGATSSETSPAAGTTGATAAVRRDFGCTDTDVNSADFSITTPLPRNTSSAPHPCGLLPTAPKAAVSVTPSSAAVGEGVLVEVAVVPGENPTSTGLSVTADLSPLGGPASQPLFDDGSNGDSTPGDGTFAVEATVGLDATPGTKTVRVAVTDAQGRSTAATATAVVKDIVPIHTIQGTGPASPMDGAQVTTTGIVTALRRDDSFGFFIEAAESETDGDSLTSEGLFVSLAASASLPAIGSRVQVTGTVTEDAGMTTVSESPVVLVRSTGNPLPGPVALDDPTADVFASEAARERLEGMRVRFAHLVVVGPTGGRNVESPASGGSNGVFTAVLAGTARPFREPGLAGTAPVPGIALFDGNPERWTVDTLALGGAALDASDGTLVDNAAGPIADADGRYALLLDAGAAIVTRPPEFAPDAAGASDGFSAALLDLGRLYDTADDPGDDLVMTPAAFDARLGKASLAIRGRLLTPDILGVTGVENLQTLQALAARVNADATRSGQPNPEYSALLVDGHGADLLDVGFLTRQASVHSVPRVSVTAAAQVGPQTTYQNTDAGTTEPLHERPPLALTVQVADPRGGAGFALTVVLAQFTTAEGSETTAHVRERRALQALDLGRAINVRQAAGEHVLVLGAFDAFPFSDGCVDVTGTVVGAPTADPILRPTADVVEPNLVELRTRVAADQQYTAVVDGNAAQLDHLLVSSSLAPRLVRYAPVRLNADVPEVLYTDGSRPERLAADDPLMAWFSFPTSDVAVTQSQSPNPVATGAALTYSVIVENTSLEPAAGVTLHDVLPAGAVLASYVAPTGWSCAPAARGLDCQAATLPPRSSATLAVTARVGCGVADGGQILNVATVGSSTYDPVPDNNSASLQATVGNPPPSLADAAASPSVLWPANGRMVSVTIDYTAGDNCSAAPVCTLSVTSNERKKATRDWRRAPRDWDVIDAHSVLLRAERTPAGNGRVYTVGITCTDGSGAQASQSVTVTVPTSRRPVHVPPGHHRRRIGGDERRGQPGGQRREGREPAASPVPRRASSSRQSPR